jgi:hypothetical protein
MGGASVKRPTSLLILNAAAMLALCSSFMFASGCGPSPKPQNSPAIKAAIDGFPYELTEVPGKDAVGKLEALRVLGRQEGFTPVLLGDGKDLESIYNQLKEQEKTKPEDILKKAMTIDPDKWMADRKKSDPETYGDQVIAIPETPDAGSSAPQPMQTLFADKDVLTGKFKAAVYIAKIPAVPSWKVPAYLKWGGWNECPPPDVQAAISKRWFEKYQADIAAVTPDTVEYLVGAPPSGKDEVHQLALEQYLFCSDIVNQGVGSLPALEKTIVNAKVWFFWWD